MSSISNDLLVLLPEGLLALAAMALLLIGVLLTKNAFRAVSTAAIVALAVAAWFVVSPVSASQNAFHGAFVADGFARFAKLLVLLGSALTLLMSQEFLEREKIAPLRIPVLVLLATIGMLFHGFGGRASLRFTWVSNCRVSRSMCSRPSTAIRCVPVKRASNTSFWAHSLPA